jgi:hypothetical protein
VTPLALVSRVNLPPPDSDHVTSSASASASESRPTTAPREASSAIEVLDSVMRLAQHIAIRIRGRERERRRRLVVGQVVDRDGDSPRDIVLAARDLELDLMRLGSLLIDRALDDEGRDAADDLETEGAARRVGQFIGQRVAFGVGRGERADDGVDGESRCNIGNHEKILA